MGSRDNSGTGVWKYRQISTATTTIVATGPCLFGGIQVVTGGAASVVTVWDNTAASGAKLADAITTAVAGLLALAPSSPGGVQLDNGLTVVTATGTPAVINVFYWPLASGVS